MKKSIKLLAVAGLLMMAANSCYYDKFDELHPIINTGCDSANATYSAQVSKIINTYCVSCHSGSGPSGGVLLDNYGNVKSQASSGNLMNALNGNGVPAMPPNTHLDACKLGAIQHWIKSGMPNN